MAVPNSKYTAIPAAAISIPATQINRDNPTLPDREKMALGVAKIPVPIIPESPLGSFLNQAVVLSLRLKIKNTAEVTPIWRFA